MLFVSTEIISHWPCQVLSHALLLKDTGLVTFFCQEQELADEVPHSTSAADFDPSWCDSFRPGSNTLLRQERQCPLVSSNAQLTTRNFEDKFVTLSSFMLAARLQPSVSPSTQDSFHQFAVDQQ